VLHVTDVVKNINTMGCSCGTSCDCLGTATITIPSGANGSDGAAGAAGADGADGANGAAGVFGGYSGNWLYNTSTATGPAATFLRFDNATLASATLLHVNDVNADSIDYTNFLASFANIINSVSQFGILRIWKRYDSTQFWMGSITAVTDNTTDYTFAVTYIEDNGTFSDNDELVVSFTPNGEIAGLGGTSIVSFDNENVVVSGLTSNTGLVSYPIPLDSLSTKGDTIEIEAYIITDAFSRPTKQDNYSISLGEQGIALDYSELTFNMKGNKAQGILIKQRIMRSGLNEAWITTTVFYAYTSSGNVISGVNASATFMNSIKHVIDWSAINLFQITVNASVGFPTELTNELLTFSAKYLPFKSL